MNSGPDPESHWAGWFHCQGPHVMPGNPTTVSSENAQKNSMAQCQIITNHHKP